MGVNPTSMDIFIRQKKLKLENINDGVPLSHYLDDQKIFKFLGIAFQLTSPHLTQLDTMEQN